MKYSNEIIIDLPRTEVVALFDNADNLYKWQPGLQSFEHVSGTAGEPGATSRLKYKMGSRNIEMIETIVSRNLPKGFSATYETKGVWNLVENDFVDRGAFQTLWRIRSEFKAKGFVKLLTIVAPGMFKKQTCKNMEDFKAFAEGQHSQG